MNDLERKLWHKVEKYLPILQIVPFVKMITVCNNLAFGKVDEKSDIDIFIVAKEGRLFFVRSFVTFILHVLGVRRHGNKVAGRFCLSFFVDERGADLSRIALEKDIYLAFWVKNLVPLFDNNFTDEFMKKNDWARTYFENDEEFVLKKDKIFKMNFGFKFLQGIFHAIFRGKVGDFVENKLKNWQLRRAKEKARHIGKEGDVVLSEHILKFHNIDRRREYRGLWREKFGNAKLKSEKFLEIC